MNIVTLNSSVTVPAGSLLSLTHDQAVAREGLLTAVNTKEIDKAVAVLATAKAALGNLRRPQAAASTKDMDAAQAKVSAARTALAKLRGIWRAKLPVFFVGGEEIGFEGNANAREVREALGTDAGEGGAASVVDAARAEGVAAGRAQLLAEVTAYNAALDAADEAQEAIAKAEAALEAEDDVTKKSDLEKALKIAQQAAKQADAAAAELKPVA